jgi:hypothetical protein
MNQLPQVFIIILNWNGWRDTLACVESCRKLTWPNFRIVVVDNASSDGSEENLHRQLPDVEIIQTGANLGFAGGNNVGVKLALTSGADYVWLLNNDTIADPGALTAMVEAMEREPAAGMAGSKIYFFDSPRLIWSTGGAWRRGRLSLRMRGAFQLDRGQFDKPGEVGSVSGCSMLVRSAVISEIGLMKEEYFLYWEDIEWCARAQEAGYKAIYVPGSLVWHRGSASTEDGSFLQFYYSTRNGFSFLRGHAPCLSPVFAFYCVMFVLKSLFAGNTRPLKGYVLGIADFVRGVTGPLGAGKD